VKAEGLPGVIELLERHEITVYHSTLPVFRDVARALAARGLTLPSMRVVALGGDFIYRDDVELLRRSFPPTAVLMNCYGATESSSALMNICDRSSQLPGTVVPLGHPVHDTEVSLLDDSGNRVTGVGEQGEIVLRSRYLSPGYLPPTVPEAARFRPDPEGGARRVYHTGDLGRYVEDGSILLIGRKDFQVKISGIRVELGEVEGALKELDGVADAVVAAREDVPGERYLAAYVVLKPGRALTVDILRRELARTVPEHAVPSVYVFLDALPRTPNNKIDRGALQAPERTRPRLGNTYVAPASRHEQIIAEIWREVLGLDDCGIDDNFFDLGGSSMRLLAVNQRLRAALNRDVPMVEMYRNPTIRALVASLNLQGQSSTAAERGTARGARRARWSKRGRSET
ncbi:MAG TPA: non-ribosomal peptide synthetase, partial [Haliangium sp.]|nr:non-ribosomal peptide synthetase [Haliangium sp.]